MGAFKLNYRDYFYCTKKCNKANHLGNVLTLFTDKKIPVGTGSTVSYYKADLVSSMDYSPFGAPLKGRTFNGSGSRYGFNGQEKDNEIAGAGNSMTAEFWQYDSRLGRRWNIDPVIKPWESSYGTFASNPIYFNDPNGDDVDGDKKGMEDYQKYRTEVNDRIKVISEKMKDFSVDTKEYNDLNNQLKSYTDINEELNRLENDKKNLYYINSNANINIEGVGGKTYYKGVVNYKGREVKQINIDLKKEIFPLNNLAHEFKHAFQYFEGRVLFAEKGGGGLDSKELEKEAYERGHRFSGNTMYNNNKFSLDYKFNIDKFSLPEDYFFHPEKAQSILEPNFKKSVDHYNSKNKTNKYIYNE